MCGCGCVGVMLFDGGGVIWGCGCMCGVGFNVWG